jgi:ABC-2 type transport system permease protein
MLDRLRANPMTKKVADRLGGSARVSSIWVKTASEHQISLFSAVAYMFLVGLMLGAFWRAIPEDTFALYNQLPEGLSVMFELFGGGDITTAEGFVQIETFGMMGPIMVMLVTISIAANAIAGEEAKRTMGLLLANPISRSRIIAEKTFTMLLYASIVGVLSFAGTMAGSVVGDQGLAWQNVAAICVLLTLIGLVGGGLSLAIGAGTGRKGAAVWGAIGFMVAMHVMNSLGEIAENPAWQKLSPFYYYLGGDPLNNGLDWLHAGVLAAAAVVLIAIAFPLFQRRDVREKD